MHELSQPTSYICKPRTATDIIDDKVCGDSVCCCYKGGGGCAKITVATLASAAFKGFKFNGSQVWVTFVLADPAVNVVTVMLAASCCYNGRGCMSAYIYGRELKIDPGKICKYVPNTGPAEVASQATTCFRP